MSIYEYRPILIYCVCLAAVFGAVMGSFLNCAAYRMAHGESFLKGRSRCPKCGHVLGPLELIPVISWVLLKGKCKGCGEKISVRYPVTEVFFAAVTVICLIRFDLTILCLRNYIFLCCLFGLSLTDLESMIIPDGFHIAMLLAWAASLPFMQNPAAFAGKRLIMAVGFGGAILLVSIALDKALGKESLGGGDIKLIAVSTLYLGAAGMLFSLILSCVAGLIYAAASGSLRNGKAFPFGPFIAGACGCMCLFGDPLVNWYLGLLGI